MKLDLHYVWLLKAAASYLYLTHSSLPSCSNSATTGPPGMSAVGPLSCCNTSAAAQAALVLGLRYSLNREEEAGRCPLPSDSCADVSMLGLQCQKSSWGHARSIRPEYQASADYAPPSFSHGSGCATCRG